MADIWAYGLFCFVSLFAVVEPVGLIPMYIAMTARMPPAMQRAIARRACLTAYLTLLLFALSGQYVFRLFGISIDSLKVVGGILFFLIGFEMVQARHTRTAVDDSPEDNVIDIALTPLGIPMIAGPGAIANVTVLWTAASSWSQYAALLLSMTLVIALTWLLLHGARRVARFLGESGNKVLLRLMGLITMVIAVEFFFAGLTPIVQRMVRPT